MRLFFIFGIAFLVILISGGMAIAYTDQGSYFLCYNRSDCNAALNNDTHNKVMLGADINNLTGGGISIPTSNKIFDGQGFEIDGDDIGYDVGISVDSKNNITIRNFTISDFRHGMKIRNSGNLTLEDITTKSNRDYGIFFIEGCYDSRVSNVSSSFNDQRGLYVLDSTNLIIEDSRFYNNSVGIYASESIGLDISDCNAYSNGVGIQFYKNVSSSKIYNNYVHDNKASDPPDGCNAGIVLTVNSCYNDIYSNIVEGNCRGIRVFRNSTDNRIFNNTAIYNSWNGILIDGWTSNNLVISNNASHNGNFGIRKVGKGSNNTIIDNTANYNYYYGLNCHNSPNGSNIFHNNTAKYNGYAGMRVTGKTYNLSISSNDVTSNPYYGIKLGSETSGCEGCGNIGDVVDFGENYVSNLSQSCYVYQCEDLDDEGRLGCNGTYILGMDLLPDCTNMKVSDLTLKDKNNTYMLSVYANPVDASFNLTPSIWDSEFKRYKESGVDSDTNLKKNIFVGESEKNYTISIHAQSNDSIIQKFWEISNSTGFITLNNTGFGYDVYTEIVPTSEPCLGDCYSELNCTGEVVATNITCFECINTIGSSWMPNKDTSCFGENDPIELRLNYCPQCCDGNDNDFDGNIDYPSDEECEYGLGVSETHPPRPVPEPSTIILLVIALPTLGVYVRSSRRQ